MMETQEQTKLHELIENRWSPRAFADRPVEPEKLKLLFEAARWAASSMNEQPWRFLIAQKSNPEEFQKMLGILMEMNQVWAQHAPVLGFSVGKKTFSYNGSANKFGVHDTGMALANLMIQATALGLHVHAMGGFSAEKAREVFHVPDDFEIGAAFAIGYLGDAASLPEKLREKEVAPRVRRSLDETVFSRDFGVSAQL